MSTYTLIPLIYEANLIKHYRKLRHLPGFVLLESCDKRRGRYDIVSAFPYQKLICSQADDPLMYLQRLRSSLPPQKMSACHLPFQGGAIGYFSYDFGLKMHGLTLKSQGALADYTLQPLAVFGLYDWAIIADHQKQQVVLLAMHEEARTQTVIDDILALWHRDDSSIPINSTLPISWQPLTSKTDYFTAFDDIQAALQAGRCYQVNLTQAFRTSYFESTWSLYEKLRPYNPVPFAAFLEITSYPIVSFSPERFMTKTEQGQLLTSPIKGTAKQYQNKSWDERSQYDLLHSAKNRAENIMIVDLWRNDFSKIAKPGSVQVKNLCQLESYHAIHHLVSYIEADALPEVDAVTAFAACFPGASITGAPKREAMKVINEQESLARGVYTGSIAYFSSHGRMDSNITIRTLIAHQKEVTLSVGGGIVIASEKEDEYQECLIKMASFLF